MTLRQDMILGMTSDSPTTLLLCDGPRGPLSDSPDTLFVRCDPQVPL